MSADNWGACPKCVHVATQAHAVDLKKANESYGKVSPEVYRAMIQKAERPLEHANTLREDYEMGINNDGLFYVKYQGRCTSCGFSFSFDQSVAAYDPNEEKSNAKRR